MTLRDLPNLISLGRVCLVLPVVVLLVTERYGAALALFAVAGVSDFLDGFLAKRFGWTSRLGAILDPLADKALLVSMYLALGWLGLIPAWLVLAVIARDMVIVSGAVAYHFKIGRFETAPTVLSKVNTFVQILLALLVVFAQGVMPLPAFWITALTWIVLATTVASGASYVWTWSWRAWNAGRRKLK
ncbi:MAG: CDP-alcohol phosphatidyltransferase family protein [Gammaproteobacteria bacterium]